MHYIVHHQFNDGHIRPNLWDLRDPRTGKDLDINQATEAVFGALTTHKWVWGVITDEAGSVGYIVPERELRGISVTPADMKPPFRRSPEPVAPPDPANDPQSLPRTRSGDAGPTEEPLWVRKHVL